MSMNFSSLLNPSARSPSPSSSARMSFSFLNAKDGDPAAQNGSGFYKDDSSEATGEAMDVDSDPRVGAATVGMEVKESQLLSAPPSAIRQTSEGGVVGGEESEDVGMEDGVVPDSDADEQELLPIASTSEVRMGGSAPTTKVKKESTEEEDTFVDIMGDSDAKPLVPPLPKPRSKPRSKPSKSKSRDTDHSQSDSNASTRDASPAENPFPFGFDAVAAADAEAGSDVEPTEILDYDGNLLTATDVTFETLHPQWDEYKPINLNWYEDDNTAAFGVGQKKKGAGGGQGKKKKGKGAEGDAEEEDEKDDRLYCICKTLYDVERNMILCDKCEEWYHNECIGIEDNKVSLVDQFICPNCEKTSSEKTTWKAPCHRPTCLKPVAPLSKYCSDFCGIEVAATRLELSGLPPEAYWSRVVGARKMHSAVVDVTNLNPSQSERIRIKEVEDEKVRKGLESRLSELVARRLILERNLNLVGKRSRYLEVAIRRWEHMCQLTADAVAAASGIDPSKPSTTSKSKGKKKSGGVTSSPDALCGFDVRLVFDSEQWENWVESSEGRLVLGREDDGANMTGEEGVEVEGVCMRLKKKCDRHLGWQKVREADFGTEKAVLTRRLERLADQERGIRGQMEDHDEATLFSTSNRHRSVLPNSLIDVSGKMKTPEKKPKKVVHPAVVNAIKRKVVREETSEDSESVGGDNGYAIPEDVLQFLSRSERAKFLKERR